MSYDKAFKKLREKYTVEEIAESMMIPADLTEEEQKAADEELRKIRFQKLKDMIEEAEEGEKVKNALKFGA